jgi:hypothetical protein
MLKPLLLAVALSALAPIASIASPPASPPPDPGVVRVTHLTVAAFLGECDRAAPDCAADAKSIDERLKVEAVVRRVNNPEQLASDYCEPPGMTDEARRDILISFLRIHPELAAGSLNAGAQQAFHSAWSERCAEADRAHAATIERLEHTTVAQYLDTCKSDDSACAALSGDAQHELGRRAFRATAEQAAAYGFCLPDLPPQDVRTAIVGYLNKHPELASHTILEGGRKALAALWPNHGEC